MSGQKFRITLHWLADFIFEILNELKRYLRAVFDHDFNASLNGCGVNFSLQSQIRPQSFSQRGKPCIILLLLVCPRVQERLDYQKMASIDCREKWSHLFCRQD